MLVSKFSQLRTDCQSLLADDNLEQCLILLVENIENNNDLVCLRGRLNSLLRDNRNGIISRDDYDLKRNKFRADLLEFIDTTIKADDISMLNKIHERILIVACKSSPTHWEKLFSDIYFSHKLIIHYGDEVPTEFKNPDVIIFDDLDCPGLIGNRNHIKKYSEEMPLAHILYFGESKGNPFQESKSKDEQAIFARMSNANSRITIPSRLKELLEFRKLYGPPLGTIILENMKDKYPLKVFISYSHMDEDLKNELDLHLASLKRQNLIEVWQDRKIKPGDVWNDEIKNELLSSNIVLLLISPGFMNSKFIWDNEVPIAMRLHEEGKVNVIPIFLKAVDLQGSPFEKFQGLPRDAKFVDTFSNLNNILVLIAKELRSLIENWWK